MLGRIKNRMMRSSSDSDSSSRARIASPIGTAENAMDYNAKLTDLASFDACVEACDAMAASSSLATSNANVDEESGIKICAVMCSPDGDILILPETMTEDREKEDGADEENLENDAEFGGEHEDGDDNAQKKSAASSCRHSDDMYRNAVELGNDLKPDRSSNGFSALGWSAAATSLAVRQTESTLRDYATYLKMMIESRKKNIEGFRTASAKFREAAGIGALGESHLAAFPPTPMPASIRGNRRQVRGNSVDLNTLSQLEPIGSSWKNNFGKQNSDLVEIATHRVGPMLYSGGSLYSAIVALEHYHSASIDKDEAVITECEVLEKIHVNSDNTAERAYHREKALKEMHRKVLDTESRLNYCKMQSQRRWDLVHQAEETVTKIVEQRMMERSRAREQQRFDQMDRDHELNKDNVHLGATNSEIWELVAAATASMEQGDFTPIDLPTAPVAGPIDRTSSGQEPEGQEIPYSDSLDEDGDNPITSRADVEHECNLPELRAAAVAADEAIEDAAQTLLTVLSSLDTTRRSARVAAETSLLSACNEQAEAIRIMVKAERAMLEDRLKSLQELEGVVENIDVRKDLDMYINRDKKERGGSTWMGEYDDAGIASALAVLSSHVEGSNGVGRSSSPRDLEATWGASYDENEVTPEALEDAIDEIFDENPLLGPAAPDGEDRTKARDAHEEAVDLLCTVASDRSNASKSRRSTICYALNAKRSSAEIKTPLQFESLFRVFHAILSGCDNEPSGVANAKMCMMLSQTFYFVENDDKRESSSSAASSKDSPKASTRSERTFVKTKLYGHPVWEDDEFWDQALYQCVTESLTHSGVMQNFERASGRTKRSEWTQTRKLKWHDLNHPERSEAATQVHAVVFAQLGALAHSMMEFGCGIERACAFVRRMSVRNQLPITQRSMLLNHLMGKKNDK